MLHRRAFLSTTATTLALAALPLPASASPAGPTPTAPVVRTDDPRYDAFRQAMLDHARRILPPELWSETELRTYWDAPEAWEDSYQMALEACAHDGIPLAGSALLAAAQDAVAEDMSCWDA